eukprot:TRINITY_DN2046_c0_g1_i2.p1 TRINITY_DN2046_c0_g1~~TRINITY_DN2046_c0_g1_i2.p1  ORF type:complete len:202 (+),score=31.46 TRINITY_DN2046_c0_g1_i2:153-758(+)
MLKHGCDEASFGQADFETIAAALQSAHVENSSVSSTHACINATDAPPATPALAVQCRAAHFAALTKRFESDHSYDSGFQSMSEEGGGSKLLFQSMGPQSFYAESADEGISSKDSELIGKKESMGSTLSSTSDQVPLPSPVERATSRAKLRALFAGQPGSTQASTGVVVEAKSKMPSLRESSLPGKTQGDTDADPKASAIED